MPEGQNVSNQPDSGVAIATTKDGREVQQAKVNFKAFENVTPINDADVTNKLVHSESAADAHHAEIQQALNAMNGEDVADLDAAPSDEFDSDMTTGPSEEEQHKAEVEAAMSAEEQKPVTQEDIDREQERPPEDQQAAADAPQPPRSEVDILLELERKERAIQDERRELAAEREELQNQGNQAQQQLNAIVNGIRTDPMSILQQAGWTMQSLSKYILERNDNPQAPVGPPQGYPQNPQTSQQPQGEIAALRQQIEQLQHMMTVAPKVNNFENQVRDLLNLKDYELLKGVDNPVAKANSYATEYMKKYKVGIEALSAKDVMDRMLDVRRQELDALKSSDAALQYLGFGSSEGSGAPTAQTSQPEPRTTLTSSHDEAPSREPAKEPESHEDIVRDALKHIPKGALRGFN